MAQSWMQNHQESSSMGSSSWVRLNVGGKLFCTSIDTLTTREPDSMLSAMFGGRHTLKLEDDGYVLIDRNGHYFGYILDWLRDGELPCLEPSHAYKQLLREAEYFRLSGLIDGINIVLNGVGSSDLSRGRVIKCILSSSERRFRGVNLSGIDLSKLDLSKADFSYASLRNVSFSGANLKEAKFYKADIEGVTFCDSILQCSLFTEAKIVGTSFVGADFDCLISDPETRDYYTDLKHCTFCKANIREASFDGAGLAGWDLTSACLMDCSFVGADLDKASLLRAHVTNTNFEGATLSRINMKGIKFSNSSLKDANLEEAYLHQVDLHRQGVCLDGANLNNAEFFNPYDSDEQEEEYQYQYY